jgi:hypothetical protein
VTPGWGIVSFLLPPLAAVLAAFLIRPRNPKPQVLIALNTILPGAGLAAAGRPTIEIVLGVVFAQFSLILAGGTQNIWMYAPSMVVGGCWALFHTALSPLAGTDRRIEKLRRRIPESDPSTSRKPAPPTARITATEEEDETVIETHYCVEVKCTECGAAVPVPVLHHMAHCSYCGSDHLVVGHEETLFVTLPERVYDANVLREALLDHYRYRYYLDLYRRTVAPLAGSATEASPSGALVNRTEFDAAIGAAEAMVSRKADRYRSKLAENLLVGTTLHFLTPYRHGMGTLYQAAFGRSQRDQEKLLRFDVGTIEAAVSAVNTLDLPPMGKLSYLKTLRPAADLSTELLSLPLEGDDEDLVHEVHARGDGGGVATMVDRRGSRSGHRRNRPSRQCRRLGCRTGAGPRCDQARRAAADGTRARRGTSFRAHGVPDLRAGVSFRSRRRSPLLPQLPSSLRGHRRPQGGRGVRPHSMARRPRVGSRSLLAVPPPPAHR